MHTTKTYTLAEATKKLQHYCAYQERCHQEVRKKLKSMRMIQQAIDQITTHLTQQNYLNEERFAKSFARGKFRNKQWGKNRIIRELKQRNITPSNIKRALTQIKQEEYLSTLDELTLKRWTQLHDTQPQKRKKKVAQYLLYRGWESDLVYQKIQELS